MGRWIVVGAIITGRIAPGMVAVRGRCECLQRKATFDCCVINLVAQSEMFRLLNVEGGGDYDDRDTCHFASADSGCI